MNMEFYDKQDIDTKLILIEEYKIRRKKYLKKLRRVGIKVRNMPKDVLKKIILCMDKIEDIKKEKAMVKRQYTKEYNEEPEQKSFPMPSEGKEHLFQVTDIITNQDELGVKLGLDDNTVCAKLEVVGGDEEGRTTLNRCSLDEEFKGFFGTRLFLKAIDLPYKGKGLSIDTDDWNARQFYATVIHNTGKNGKKFCNINEYNFDKKITQYKRPANPEGVIDPSNIAWDE